MKVWIVEVCTCDEYGCMEFAGVFSSMENAHEWAELQGLQCEDRGSSYNARTDYYHVREEQIDLPKEFEPY